MLQQQQDLSASYTGGVRLLRPQRGAAASSCALADPAGPGRVSPRGCRAAGAAEEGCRRDEAPGGRGERSDPSDGPSASPTAALSHGSSSAVARGHSEEGTKWQVHSEHSACHTGDALQGGDSILSSSPPAPSSFFLSPGSAPPGLLASRTLRLKLRL